ncbi:TolC family protein [Salinisphaera sp. T31B1]|uniref:TolC family protein n=1 Tax=Salinisphaera sp. T31B1 TaxID=727963 RepID=UPI0033429E3F
MIHPRHPIVALLCGAVLVFAAGPGRAQPVTADSAYSLSLQQAIDGALATNVQTLLADARRDEAAGSRAEARSAFLPHVSADVSQSRRQTNLAAQGIDFGSALSGSGNAAAAGGLAFPSVVTYNSFDARATLRQSLFDYSAWQQYQGAKIGEEIADDQLAVAREQVATQAALDYVQALAARESVTAAQADLDLSRTLTDLATDQENVGIATGVDVTRAQTRQARARARLAQARTDQTRADIRLARTVGLPLNAPLALSDRLAFRAVADGDISDALGRALAARPEIRLAARQIHQREKLLAAARGQRLPTLSAMADYGESGNTYRENDEDTYTVGAQIQIPIFDGGAIGARIDSAASRLAQQRIQYRDTRQQVEQDVRLARRTLTTLADQVDAAQAALGLAERELNLSRDRFANGLTDNIEVVDAQASLADARNTQVAALADYTRARINLAAALGAAQQFRLESSAP